MSSLLLTQQEMHFSKKSRIAGLNAAMNDNIKSRYAKVKDHKLTKAFAKVAKESGMKTAFKMAAAGGAGFAGANIYVVAAAGGFGYTLAEAIQEFRKAQNELKRELDDHQDQSQGFWAKMKKFGRTLRNFGNFVVENKSRFFGKFLKNTGLSLAFSSLGSFLADHSDTIKGLLSRVPGAEKIGYILSRTGQAIQSLGVSAAHAAEAPSATDIKETNEILQSIFSLDTLNTEGWDAKALSDLEAAKKGQSWALQNLADYSANGRHGVSVDYMQARALAEQAQEKGSRLAARFLADLDRISPVSSPAEAMAMPEVDAPEIAEQAQASPSHEPLQQTEVPPVNPIDGFDFASVNTEGWSTKALSDFQAAKNGQSWALQNIAHYAANGLQGITQDYDLARSMATAAKEKGNALSERFLASLDKIVPHAAPAETVAQVFNQGATKICYATGFTNDILSGLGGGTSLNCDSALNTMVAANEEVIAKISENGREVRFKNGLERGVLLEEFLNRIRVTLSLNPELAQAEVTGPRFASNSQPEMTIN